MLHFQTRILQWLEQIAERRRSDVDGSPFFLSIDAYGPETYPTASSWALDSEWKQNEEAPDWPYHTSPLNSKTTVELDGEHLTMRDVITKLSLPIDPNDIFVPRAQFENPSCKVTFAFRVSYYGPEVGYNHRKFNPWDFVRIDAYGAGPKYGDWLRNGGDDGNKPSGGAGDDDRVDGEGDNDRVDGEGDNNPANGEDESDPVDSPEDRPALSSEGLNRDRNPQSVSDANQGHNTRGDSTRRSSSGDGGDNQPDPNRDQEDDLSADSATNSNGVSLGSLGSESDGGSQQSDFDMVEGDE